MENRDTSLPRWKRELGGSEIRALLGRGELRDRRQQLTKTIGKNRSKNDASKHKRGSREKGPGTENSRKLSAGILRFTKGEKCGRNEKNPP